MRQIAQLIKADVGVEVAFADIGGWDHHVNEVGPKPPSASLRTVLANSAASLAAFYQDLGDRMEDVVVVTMSEFGRTAKENGNRGTDHGHANVMFVMGGPVKGRQGLRQVAGPCAGAALRGARPGPDHGLPRRAERSRLQIAYSVSMPGRDFYLWQAHSFTARVALDLVNSLGRALADPRHKQGAELGGVLFGRTLQPEIIEITEFEFIHSEHHRGTIFALGLRERYRLARQLAAMNSGSDVRPVGFFRTHLRPGLFLDQDDFAFMTEAFADPAQVALLIRPAEAGPAAAGFFIWEEGDIDRRQTPLSFPFDSQALRAQGPTETQSIQPRKAMLALPSVHIPVPRIRKPLLGWWSWGSRCNGAARASACDIEPTASPPAKGSRAPAQRRAAAERRCRNRRLG
jgi:hypothetical protein